MKKLFLSIAVLFCAASFSFASGNYTLNTTDVDRIIESAEDVSLFTNAAETLNLPANATSVSEGGKSVGGYLVRSFFCGIIGLHRSYMGTNGRSVWWWYLCVPVAGGVTGCVDFWGVVFGGQKQLNKYANNDKLIVWL